MHASCANKLGLDGWVRNRIDDTVEVLVAGEAEKVEALIALCHEGAAHLRAWNGKVDLHEAEEMLEEKGFQAPAYRNILC